MDLGCIDMGCVEKEIGSKEASATKPGRSNKTKDALRSSLSMLNKLTSQISKPPHRKVSSPVNWSPRKKVEPYLKRKIKLLQEVDGMHSTLDETLGDSNLHYSKVLKEKMAIREAAEKAMITRKAAMVEASWCRILQASRIDSKGAEDQLMKAKRSAAEAVEAAKAAGVIMNDNPDSARNLSEIETFAKGGSTTHAVSASFETPFEVDRQVASAVKAAFMKLANCPPINKDEFKELLRKISENPDKDEKPSEMMSDVELETEARQFIDSLNHCDELEDGMSLRKHKKRRDSDKFSMANMVDMMLGRLRNLKEDELASLATIVATSGLNAVLAETENNKQCDLSCAAENTKACGGPKVLKRSSLSRRTSRNSIAEVQARGTGDAELLSLDKFLVKHLTRLEREVLEAKNARENVASDVMKVEHTCSRTAAKLLEGTTVPDLGSMLVKHSSKLEKEIEQARMKSSESAEAGCKGSSVHNKKQDDVAEVPSLDKYLVKHLTRLEREVQEARNQTKLGSTTRATAADQLGKENMVLNQIKNEDSIFPKPAALPLQTENNQTKDGANHGSLEKISVKHVSRLEKEKQEFHADDEQMRTNPKRKEMHGRGAGQNEGSLEQVLVKHKSRLEKERMAAANKEEDDNNGFLHSVSRRHAREKELQAAWGGLSLGNSMRPHISRLQREKAAWIKAEEEERKRAMEGKQL